MEPQVDRVDLLVIGGGINGAAVAANAAGRGLTVILCEKDDLASHTSSASSKLIHGGLRYLEQGDFKLVREGLSEREILLTIAPHIVHPLEFVLPHNPRLRSRFLLRLGLFFYDYLARRKRLKKSTYIKLNRNIRAKPLKPHFTNAFTYLDCWTDDARLVVLNAMLAREKGARVYTRTEVTDVFQEDGCWSIRLLDKKNNRYRVVKAKAIVNAGGAWVAKILQKATKTSQQLPIKLVKGSHLLVPKLYEGDFAYILQHSDKRVIFVIPWRKKFSLIGTTDVLHENDPNRITVSEEEIDYLLGVVRSYFVKVPTSKEIVWSYAGVRTLYTDAVITPSKITRDYHLELTEIAGKCPILSVVGGKLTTYRSLSEKVLNRLAPYFPRMTGPWTASGVLPGGDLGDKSFIEFQHTLLNYYRALPAEMIVRLAGSYGTLTHDILRGAFSLDALGEHFGGGLYEAEVEYLAEQEWAQTSDDILWRRTKLGLNLKAHEVNRLNEYLHSGSVAS